MDRNCDVCGIAYSAHRPNSRFCSDTCRKRAQRGALTAENGRSEAEFEGPGAVEGATLAALEAAGRLETPLGQAALTLARRLDHSEREPAAGVATVAKQLGATLEAATAGANKAADPLDELKTRRDRLFAG
jgi:hypothetical protein